MGVLATPLDAASPDFWTRGQAFEVELYGGGLSSRPDAAVLNGANMAAILSPSGQWEIIQFRDAELLFANTWRLSTLLRGQAGTEAFIGDPTPAGAAFVLLDDAVSEIVSPSSFRSLAREWRIGPTRKPVSHDSYTSFVAADEAARLRPYAPAHLRASIEPLSGALAINWIRRTRVDGDTWTGVDAPFGETSEAYRVRVGSVLEKTALTQSLTIEAQELIGASISGVTEVGVSQISDQFGPGPETRVTINV